MKFCIYFDNLEVPIEFQDQASWARGFLCKFFLSVRYCRQYLALSKGFTYYPKRSRVLVSCFTITDMFYCGCVFKTLVVWQCLSVCGLFVASAGDRVEVRLENIWFVSFIFLTDIFLSVPVVISSPSRNRFNQETLYKQ